ncbi:MAG: hypothetical protein R2729_13045 [Bryobacteraceae bacterium]
MTDYNDTNHVLVWDKQASKAPAQQSIAHLGNLLSAPRMWAVDGSKAQTRNLLSKKTTKGLPDGQSLFVAAFLVLKGDTAQAIELTGKVNWSFLTRFTLTAEAKDHADSYATVSYLPVSGAAATMVLLWARNKKRSRPDIPTDLVMEVINAYNEWGRFLRSKGHHLDSARLNVRLETFHIDDGVRRSGRITAGRLAAVGSFPKSGRKPLEALKLSGLDSHRFVLDVGRGNGWWSSLSGVPAFYDHPINAIVN